MKSLTTAAGLAVLILLKNDRGTRHLKLIAFTAHGLDQNSQVQLTSTRDYKRLSPVCFFHL